MEIVKSGKIFRIRSEMTLQYSVFDRKRQKYLLKDVNRCTHNFSNFVDVNRRVSWVNDITLSTIINGDGQVSSQNGDLRCLEI